MEISASIVKGYLLIVLVGGLYGVISGLVVGVRKLSWRMFFRGAMTLAIGGCFYALFRFQKLSGVGVISGVGALLILQEYLLHLIYAGKLKS